MLPPRAPAQSIVYQRRHHLYQLVGCHPLCPGRPHTHRVRALALVPDNAVLLSNLSAAHLGNKAWGAALAAAERCLAADPAFLKGYGRKAAALQGLIRWGRLNVGSGGCKAPAAARLRLGDMPQV